MNRMEPSDSKNLDAFLTKWRETGKYFLLPGYFPSESQAPKLFFDHCIEKRELHVRPAWQIGRNDPDIVAIRPGDNPIIPAGIDNPPVRQALRWLKQRRNRSK
jgi:hypothetical protein